MQRIKWHGKDALLIDFEDTTYSGEEAMKKTIAESKDIEFVIFPFNSMFIPKDLRDMLTYSKEIFILKLPKKEKVI
jgi:hypothetical protein